MFGHRHRRCACPYVARNGSQRGGPIACSRRGGAQPLRYLRAKRVFIAKIARRRSGCGDVAGRPVSRAQPDGCPARSHLLPGSYPVMPPKSLSRETRNKEFVPGFRGLDAPATHLAYKPLQIRSPCLATRPPSRSRTTSGTINRPFASRSTKPVPRLSRAPPARSFASIAFARVAASMSAGTKNPAELAVLAPTLPRHRSPSVAAPCGAPPELPS